MSPSDPILAGAVAGQHPLAVVVGNAVGALFEPTVALAILAASVTVVVLLAGLAIERHEIASLTRHDRPPKRRLTPVRITRHGRPAGVLIGFESEENRFDYRLEHHPEFVRRIAEARENIGRGRGIPLEDQSPWRAVLQGQGR